MNWGECWRLENRELWHREDKALTWGHILEEPMMSYPRQIKGSWRVDSWKEHFQMSPLIMEAYHKVLSNFFFLIKKVKITVNIRLREENTAGEQFLSF